MGEQGETKGERACETERWCSNEGAPRGRRCGPVHSKHSRGCILPSLSPCLAPPSHTLHTGRSGPINWEIYVYVCVRDGWLLPYSAVCCLRSVHEDKCDNTRLLIFRLQVNSGADCARARTHVRLAPCKLGYSLYAPSSRLLPFCVYSITVRVFFQGRRQKICLIHSSPGHTSTAC